MSYYRLETTARGHRVRIFDCSTLYSGGVARRFCAFCNTKVDFTVEHLREGDGVWLGTSTHDCREGSDEDGPAHISQSLDRDYPPDDREQL